MSARRGPRLPPEVVANASQHLARTALPAAQAGLPVAVVEVLLAPALPAPAREPFMRVGATTGRLVVLEGAVAAEAATETMMTMTTATAATSAIMA